MKKVSLIVIALLLGSVTQTFAQAYQNVIITQDYNHDYYDTQRIRFIENGVLYSVSTNGSFDFKIIGERDPKIRKRNKRNHFYGVNHHNKNYKIRTNHKGDIIKIGKTRLLYKRNGKLKTVGKIDLFYNRGRLIRVGEMEITYNRFGQIRHTHGFVNKYNRKNWHEDWLTYNDYNLEPSYWEWYQRNNERKRKVK